MPGDFFDTNVVLYLLDDSPKAALAEQALFPGGTISVQVLNEALANCTRKAGMSLLEAGEFLAGIRAFCSVVDLDLETHDVGCALAERYGFSVYDAMIVAAALLSGCDRLVTEDMQNGLVVEGRLRIQNPFVAA